MQKFLFSLLVFFSIALKAQFRKYSNEFLNIGVGARARFTSSINFNRVVFHVEFIAHLSLPTLARLLFVNDLCHDKVTLYGTILLIARQPAVARKHVDLGAPATSLQASDFNLCDRNRNVRIYSQSVQSKLLMNIFSYFSLCFLKFFKLNIFNLNYNPLFKEIVININNIFTSVINNFAKSNLTFKKFTTFIIYHKY